MRTYQPTEIDQHLAALYRLLTKLEHTKDRVQIQRVEDEIQRFEMVRVKQADPIEYHA